MARIEFSTLNMDHSIWSYMIVSDMSYNLFAWKTDILDKVVYI